MRSEAHPEMQDSDVEGELGQAERMNPFPTDIDFAEKEKVGNAFLRSEKNHKKYVLWQKSFHDHIIRGEIDYQKIWDYIDTNSLKWENDCFYIKTKKSQE